MANCRRKFYSLVFCFVTAIYTITLNAFCYEVETDSAKIDRLFAQLQSDFKFNFDRTQDTLKELKLLEPSFSKKQKDSIYLTHAAMLGFQGKQRERADLVRSYLDQVTDPNIRARFLGQLVLSYVQLGEYENAIIFMNENTELLPKLSKDIAIRSVLHSNINVLRLFKAYDEALIFANQMLQLKDSTDNQGIKCLAILNVVELNYLKGNAQRARSLIPESDIACKSQDLKLYRQILRALSVVDLINTGNFKEGITIGQPLAEEFVKFNNGTEYRIQLEEALCRAFIALHDYKLASKYGSLALDHSKSAKSVGDYEAVLSTLAKLKESQGDATGALEYMKTAFEYRRQRTDDELQKNIAYQRVKFDSRDKAAQVSLLEKKNEVLAVEREAERNRTQHLIVIVILSAVALAVLFVVLLVILKQRSKLTQAARIDQLTQIYVRSFFVSRSTEVIEKRKNEIAVILVNLDRFRRVNEISGFAIGDSLLIEVCAAIKRIVRDGDIVGRMGNDEFGICVVDASEEFASQLAERCRKAIANINFEHRVPGLNLTASFGVAVVDTKGLTSFDDTINAARDALLFAKNIGGNCVRAYGTPEHEVVGQV